MKNHDGVETGPSIALGWSRLYSFLLLFWLFRAQRRAETVFVIFTAVTLSYPCTHTHALTQLQTHTHTFTPPCCLLLTHSLLSLIVCCVYCCCCLITLCKPRQQRERDLYTYIFFSTLLHSAHSFVDYLLEDSSDFLGD